MDLRSLYNYRARPLLLAGVVAFFIAVGIALSAATPLDAPRASSPDEAVEQFILYAGKLDVGRMVQITAAGEQAAPDIQQRYTGMAQWIGGCAGLKSLHTLEYTVRNGQRAEVTVQVGFHRCPEDRVTFAAIKEKDTWRVRGMVSK